MRFIVDVVGPRVCQAATSTSRQDPTGKVQTSKEDRFGSRPTAYAEARIFCS